MDRLATAKWYTKLNLTHVYYLVQIAEGDKWKTTAKIRRHHYQYKVMPDSLNKMLATFQQLINNTHFEYLDLLCIDDILIYSDSLEEYRQARTKSNGKVTTSRFVSQTKQVPVSYAGNNLFRTDYFSEQDKYGHKESGGSTIMGNTKTYEKHSSVHWVSKLLLRIYRRHLQSL